ncbi:23S rRNA (uracil(1939)-C(5))-methyltransferase RlmD [Vibrio salinus]|uniref:23S rRNA (uracil(1939)-C(5))-methyltransferase RlmD n=1 Tax=Vibrio salinus TaxID=2899784 RepID=UPI001E484D25|nr:23S rRNA (uracil(1939)-C(5))-methyltransferase RlmD [Vibrio salinus]MCE0493411.1 23S rRNA (uracil(1939)-C(5))-methyltransferase RlmD [Vibrio salinus]
MARFFQPKKKTEINRKHQSITIARLDHLGSGIAYQNKKPIFIEGALPGETVVYQLTESKSKYSRGKLIKVLTASEERVTPFCPHYASCGGCQLQHLEHQAQIKYKQESLEQLMAKFAGQSLSLSEPVVSHHQHYRRRARFSLVWDKVNKSLTVGFRKKQSQDLVGIDHCPVLDNDLNLVLEKIKPVLNRLSKPESLGHVELIKADNERVVLLRHVKPLNEDDKRKLHQFVKQTEVTLYLMPESGMVEMLAGKVPFYEDAGLPIYFQPNHFIQVNKIVNTKMIQQAIDWLDLNEQDRVLDLFCGGGNFSLPVARKVKQVIGIEGIEEMVIQADTNAQKNDVNNALFYQANLEEDMTQSEWGREKFDKILLDPARAGAKGIIEQTTELGAKRVVYVSCNPATLARDSQSLIQQGFRLEKLAMLDMFPHTSHLESMALFVR